MGYPKNPNAIREQDRPIYGLDLQDALPIQGEDLRALAKFFHSSELGLNSIYSLVRSDNTYDRTSIDNLITLLGDLARDKVLGSLSDIEVLRSTLTDEDATSAASKTWTVGAGKVWIVLSLVGANDTRSSSFHAEYTPSGGSAVTMGRSRVTAASCAHADGGQAAFGGIENPGVPTMPFIMDSADALKLVDNSFVAADVCKKSIIYVELTK